jgi:hypothetical protein
VGDLVLKWDRVNEPKGKHSKFQNLWLGPYQIVEKIGVGTYRLQILGVNWILSLSMAKASSDTSLSLLQVSSLYHRTFFFLLFYFLHLFFDLIVFLV